MNLSRKPFSRKQSPWKGSLTSLELPCPGTCGARVLGGRGRSWQETLLAARTECTPQGPATTLHISVCLIKGPSISLFVSFARLHNSTRPPAAELFYTHFCSLTTVLSGYFITTRGFKTTKLEVVGATLPKRAPQGFYFLTLLVTEGEGKALPRTYSCFLGQSV